MKEECSKYEPAHNKEAITWEQNEKGEGQLVDTMSDSNSVNATLKKEAYGSSGGMHKWDQQSPDRSGQQREWLNYQAEWVYQHTEETQH